MTPDINHNIILISRSATKMEVVIHVKTRYGTQSYTRHLRWTGTAWSGRPPTEAKGYILYKIAEGLQGQPVGGVA